MTFIKWILKIFILAFVFLILLYSAGECRECGSISVKINLTAFTDLAECTVIRGNLMVALLERHSSVFEQFVFPKLKYVFFINRFFFVAIQCAIFFLQRRTSMKATFRIQWVVIGTIFKFKFSKKFKNQCSQSLQKMFTKCSL